jgi:hypothetical protein
LNYPIQALQVFLYSGIVINCPGQGFYAAGRK